MSKLTVCLLFSIVSLTGFSQKVYFVYLQTESEQTFYIKMNAKVYSSSASGYLILSKLRDSTYDFTVGFPQNKWSEQNFSVTINNKDHGYLLKNFGEKGWGLFDLQKLSVQMAISGSAKIEEKKTEVNRDVSVFTELLSKAADDPSLKEKPVNPEIVEKKAEPVILENVAKENPKISQKEIAEIKPVVKIEQPEIKKEIPETEKTEKQVLKVEEIVTPVTEQYKSTVVKKKSESSTTEGFGLVFIDDFGNGINDTIRLLIPNPKSVVTFMKEEPKEEKKFIDILPDTVKKKEETVTEVKSVMSENSDEKKILNNNCTSIADESDFFKLRKNMAAVDGDDNMIAEAKNYFKTKCFTTDQVKNLGLLFLNDVGKYNFFDLAYPYVSDSDKYRVLQSELKDPYYVNRFKAMLRN